MHVNGAALRAFRELQGRKQADIAKQVGIDRSTLHHLESGKRPYLSDEKLEQLASILGVPVQALNYGQPHTAGARGLLAAAEARR